MKNKQLERYKSLISVDRMSKDDEFFNLLEYDIKRTVKEYFDIKEDLKITMAKESDGYKINVFFTAVRIKDFSSLPNET